MSVVFLIVVLRSTRHQFEELKGVGLRTIAGGSLHLRDNGTRKQTIGAS
jgi:hypothetical protein